MSRDNNFLRSTQVEALSRQGNRCALCGESIFALGDESRASHAHGESAQAHHMIPVKCGGSADVTNCVVLCQSCHYTVHEGGNYRFGEVTSRAADYPYFSRW